MAAIIRLKRKACDEPAEGIVIAVKKSKCELSNSNEVLFKFAATLKSEKESVRDQIQAALTKEKTKNSTKWRDPKNTAASQCTIKKLSEKIKIELKNANAKKKLDLLNNRRLILSEEFQNLEEDSIKDAEVRQLFHLYDIIEESEEVKKKNEEAENIITCNDTPLIREKTEDYVFDVYIAEGHIDRTFVDGTVSVRPCTLAEDEIYSGGSDDSDQCYDDEDDSNDENNWRNEYPEDEDSPRDSDSGSDSDDSGSVVRQREEVTEAFNDFNIDDDDEDYDEIQRSPFDYSRIMKELKEEYSED